MLRSAFLPFFLVALLAPFAGQCQTPKPAWQTAIEQRRDKLVETYGSGTDAELRDQLLKMRDEDQIARGLKSSPASDDQAAPAQETMKELLASDARRTDALKEIFEQKGWPTIALVGIDASNAAMLVLTHTADHDWRQQILPRLQELADGGRIDPSSYALVLDKELVAAGKLQRYGSQFTALGGKIAMYAVEDPAHLDERRAEAMLPPIDVTKQQMSTMYGMQVSTDVVMATPAQTDAPAKTRAAPAKAASAKAKK
ncbi:MAG: hypothetical protein FWD64_03335 [Acidobacteriaceae bacterium]|nr:hypothetical protein [Acidobacteriaceae bacterium]